MRRLLVLPMLLVLIGGTLPSQSASAPVTVLLPVVRQADGVPFYAFYYLWWSTRHWQSKLGAGYPFDGSWPLPGSLDPTSGCGATAAFVGATITDLPSEGIYDQLNSNIMTTHVEQAAAAGLSGFLAGWEGTGAAGQTVSDSGYNRRIELLMRTVEEHNRATGDDFRLIIDYEIFGVIKTPEHLANDIGYLLERYGDSPAWARIDGKRALFWSNTRLFPTETLRVIAERFGGHLFLIGDERATTWTSERARYLDGSGHYWSSQNPYRNPQSFAQQRAFAAQVRADGRRWFAPLAPGYNDELNDLARNDPVEPEDCVPRRGTETLRQLYMGNSTARPDGWFVISWNEWVEHTYIEPSKRYGTLYLDELSRIITAARRSGP